ncbi:hypothetical protein N7468_003779 [Penicillium chermesinum]|uniref:Uncharacterized protein n=1 Tax=Penicillium chermesinum TaxID=63820 RepID=A0A9W9P7K8_9EURO|nr:uncharacterized protein N7468_003779 [Penicillium chermesinum]KAJ5239160.1 hypothetical protein N7468_003779 [Penicillium chermesinum]KAJ6164795.1 hypothetical protein N7470_003467 [Penicillium chermesinum]
MNFTPPSTDQIPTAWKKEVDKWMTYHVDFGAILMYAQGDVPVSDLEEVVRIAKDNYIKTVLFDEELCSNFLTPAPGLDTLRQKSPLELLEHHVLHQDKGWKPTTGNNSGDLDWYPFNYVVVGPSWRSEGVLVVDLASENDDYRIDSCMFKPEDLGLPLTSMIMGDEYFETLKKA